MRAQHTSLSHTSTHNVGVWTRVFIFSAFIIFAITGTAKVLSSAGKAEILRQPDPIFRIQFSSLLFLVGLVEVIVSALCLILKSNYSKLIVIALLSTNILAYRIGLLLVGYQKPCSCLGSLTSAIHVSPHLADSVMKITLLYLLVGSYAALYFTKKRYATALECDNISI